MGGDMKAKNLILGWQWTIVLMLTCVDADIGDVHVSLRLRMNHCLGESIVSFTRGLSLQYSLAVQLKCVESTIHRCSLVHAPRKRAHVEMRTFCGVINTGEQLRAHTWHISVPPKFGLRIDFLHFRLPNLSRCEHGARLIVQSSYNMKSTFSTYCGYRVPWHLALLNSTATVTLNEPTKVAVTPRGYYFVLTYEAFDIKSLYVSIQILKEKTPKRALYFRNAFIVIGQRYKLLVEFQYHFQVRVINQIRLRIDSNQSIEIYDGPGILSPRVPDDPTFPRSEDGLINRLLSSYQCFIKTTIMSNRSVTGVFFNPILPGFSLYYDSEERDEIPACSNISDTFHRNVFGPCVIYEPFKIVEIEKLMFTGYNMLGHGLPEQMCQYGGLYIGTYLYNRRMSLLHEYVRICSNVTNMAVLPYVNYWYTMRLFQDLHGYVMFMTFSGYSSGYIDLRVYDKPTHPECIDNTVVFYRSAHETLYRASNRNVTITDKPINADLKTLCTNVWLVNELHTGIASRYHNRSHAFLAGRFFPSSPFTMITATSFLLQNDVQLETYVYIVQTASGVNKLIHPRLPFRQNIYHIDAATDAIYFNVSYSGYTKVPVFALNMKFTQDKYYLCLPDEGYAVHTKKDQPLSVLVPHYRLSKALKYIFIGYGFHRDYTFGRCNALITTPSCPNSTNTELAKIHYNPLINLVLPVKIDISLRKTPLCSVKCSLNVGILDYLGKENRQRYHEWRKIYRLTWQLIASPTRREDTTKDRWFEIHINASCDDICSSICDIAVSVSLPLTSNIRTFTDRMTRVSSRYGGTIEKYISITHSNESLALVGHSKPKHMYGNWQDANTYCANLQKNGPTRLFTPKRTLHGDLWDLVNSEKLNLGWNPTREYFFAGVYYDANTSTWQLSDGSVATYIDWGLTHLHPHSANVVCPHCTHGNESIPKPEISSGFHCSALEVSEDRSHVSGFPVNCSAKYWSRVICEYPINDPQDFPPLIENGGEFLLTDGALMQSDYKCPDDYTFRLNSFCVTLTLIETPNYINDIDDFKAIMCNRSDTETRCSEMNGEIFGSTITEKYYIYDGQTQTSLYDLLLDILEEFYAESSDIYCSGDDNGIWMKYGEAGYMINPPTHPSYLPCYTAPVATLTKHDTPVSLFSCADGSKIADVLVCDGRNDCKDREDEKHCPEDTCNMFQYQCQSGGCVYYDKLCDDHAHCPYGDDEMFCHTKRMFPRFSGDYIHAMSISDLCDPPWGDMLMCRTTLQCYPSSAICHYDHSDGIMAYCEDGSHMGWGTFCVYVDCQDHYKCRGSYCIPVRKVCDGVVDCPIGDDEQDCRMYKCPGHMRCSGVSYCVPPSEICDGVAHCPLQEDEKYCQTCPINCTCSGTAIKCSNIETIDSNVSSPSALILHSSFKVFLHFLRTSQMDYVWCLDLRYGSFASNIDQILDISRGFTSVKFLYLNQQGLHVLPHPFINGPNIIYANFSHNIIQSVHSRAFDNLMNIKVLSLVSNSLQSLDSHFCQELLFLSHLYLTDNPLVSISGSSFLQNPGLKLVRSDWYIVCCLVAHIADCQLQNQFVSSCSNLIASVVQKMFIMAEAIIIIVGNAGTIIVQLLSTDDTKFLIVNLAVADLLMGGYLLAIAAVDIAYYGTFYTIIQQWTHHEICLMLGLFNFVSSQVSILMLLILSVARSVSVDKIRGMYFLKSKIWKFCIGAWAVALAIGTSYALLLMSHGLEVHNNLCIMIGLSNHYQNIFFFERTYQIMFIGSNVVALVVILATMVYIFHVVARSGKVVRQTGGAHNKSHTSKLMNLGRRLLLLLLCNVLSWLPVLNVSILLLVGVRVHEYIVQWIAILGVPICACADPFLYSISPLRAYIKERKKTAR